MNKHFRKTLVAAAVVGAVASGLPGTASAFVYGLSHLEVADLSILVAPGQPFTANSFTFSLINTAVLNGVPAIQAASCSGFPSNCGAPPSVLNAPVAQVGTPTFENNFNFVGPVGQYARADSVITSAQLVNGLASAVNTIAENNLTGTGSAQDSALLQSTTNLTFTVGAPGTSFSLTFNADVDQRVQISHPNGTGSTQSNVQATFRLTRTSAGGGFISWTPDGVIVAGDCSVSAPLAGVICSEINDGDGVVGGEDSLNNTIATGVNPSLIDYSYDVGQVFLPYGINIANLPAGTYSLSLSTTVSDDKVLNVQNVPEPASMALVGLGLLGMGLSVRRRNRNV